MKIREDVATGQQLQFAMRVSNRFPSMAIQMVAIGEESGALDSMLDKVATYYENEVDNAVDGLTSMMEPLIMAILGVLVGGLVIAMYLPIFKWAQSYNARNYCLFYSKLNCTLYCSRTIEPMYW